jgi:hypothetical protein
MTPADGLSLWAMFVLGVFGVIVHMNLDEKSRRMRTAALVWAVVWAGPPLVRLWIAGVTA